MTRKVMIYSMVLVALLGLGSAQPQHSYQVRCIYSGNTQRGLAALTSEGQLIHVNVMLVPISMPEKQYHVHVTRVGTDLYLVEGQNLYIRTRECDVVVYSADATLDLTEEVGQNRGTLTFE
jgi:hypothetical protein